MITVNLQWLALPFILYSLYCLVRIILLSTIFYKKDVEGAIAIVVSIYYALYGLLSFVIGGLIVAAFRN